MTENEIAKIVVDLCIKIHRTLGPGLLESVYEAALIYELKKLGIPYKSQVDIPAIYDISFQNMACSRECFAPCKRGRYE